MKKSKTIINIFVYALGIFMTGLAINLLIRSSFGAGAWDAVAENFSQLVHIELAYASAFFSLIILTFVIIYNKNIKFLITLIPIVGIFLSIYFWDIIVLNTYFPPNFLLKSLFFVVGLVSLTFGLAAIVSSTYPAMVYDELTIAMMKILKINSFFKTRIIIEMTAVIIGTIIGFIAGIGFGVVGLGTLLMAFVIGPMISFHMMWLSKVLKQKRV